MKIKNRTPEPNAIDIMVTAMDNKECGTLSAHDQNMLRLAYNLGKRSITDTFTTMIQYVDNDTFGKAKRAHNRKKYKKLATRGQAEITRLSEVETQLKRHDVEYIKIAPTVTDT